MAREPFKLNPRSQGGFGLCASCLYPIFTSSILGVRNLSRALFELNS